MLLKRFLVRLSPSKKRALSQAAKRGDVNEVRSLLRAGVDPNARWGGGYTALMEPRAWSDESGASVAAVLLAAGADPNARDDMGWTPLMHAIPRSSKRIIQNILDAGGDPGAADNSGLTALAHAVQECKPSIVTTLLMAGADPNDDHAIWRANSSESRAAIGASLREAISNGPRVRDTASRSPRQKSAAVTIVDVQVFAEPLRHSSFENLVKLVGKQAVMIQPPEKLITNADDALDLNGGLIAFVSRRQVDCEARARMTDTERERYIVKLARSRPWMYYYACTDDSRYSVVVICRR